MILTQRKLSRQPSATNPNDDENNMNFTAKTPSISSDERHHHTSANAKFVTDKSLLNRIKQKFEISGEHKKRIMDVFMSGWGWFFDISTIAINIVDVVSDILVCVEFGIQGHKLWFALCIAALIIANLIIAAVFILNESSPLTSLVLERHLSATKLKYCLVFAVVFPIAQLIPIAEWCVYNFKKYMAYRANLESKRIREEVAKKIADLTTLHPSVIANKNSVRDVSRHSEVYDYYFREIIKAADPPNPTMKQRGAAQNALRIEKPTAADEELRAAAMTFRKSSDGVQMLQGVKVTTGAGQEEVEAVMSSFQAMSRLDQAIKDHMKTHMYFYVETVVESIPQVIIQLLAITFLQQITPIQVVSIGTSLLSIVSKGYVLAASRSIAVVIFRFFCCASDLFSLFYIFSSLTDPNAPKEVYLLGSNTQTTWLACLFVVKWCVYAGIAFIFITLGCIYNRENLMHAFEFRKIPQYLLMSAAVIVCAAPFVIAVESLKCIFFVGLVQRYEPSEYAGPAASLLYHYLGTEVLSVSKLNAGRGDLIMPPGVNLANDHVDVPCAHCGSVHNCDGQILQMQRRRALLIHGVPVKKESSAVMESGERLRYLVKSLVISREKELISQYQQTLSQNRSRLRNLVTKYNEAVRGNASPQTLRDQLRHILSLKRIMTAKFNVSAFESLRQLQHIVETTSEDEPEEVMEACDSVKRRRPLNKSRRIKTQIAGAENSKDDGDYSDAGSLSCSSNEDDHHSGIANIQKKISPDSSIISEIQQIVDEVKSLVDSTMEPAADGTMTDKAYTSRELESILEDKLKQKGIVYHFDSSIFSNDDPVSKRFYSTLTKKNNRVRKVQGSSAAPSHISASGLMKPRLLSRDEEIELLRWERRKRNAQSSMITSRTLKNLTTTSSSSVSPLLKDKTEKENDDARYYCPSLSRGVLNCSLPSKAHNNRDSKPSQLPLDVVIHDDFVIPIGTPIDTYHKLYVDDNPKRLKALRKRQEDQHHHEWDHDHAQSSDAVMINNEEGIITSDNVNAKNKNKNASSLTTRYPHRMPFRAWHIFFALMNGEEYYKSQRGSVMALLRDGLAEFLKDLSSERRPIIALCLVSLGIFVFICGQLFSLIFPILNYIAYNSSQNLLQQMCFGAFAFCFSIVVLFVPRAIKYTLFMRNVFRPLNFMFPSVTQVEKVFEIVEKQHLPTVNQLVDEMSEGTPACLPYELNATLSSYLSHSDVDLSLQGKKDLQRIRERHHNTR